MKAVLLNIPGLRENVIRLMMGSRAPFIIAVILFMVVGYVADRWARSDTSVGLQYAGLALYTIAQAIILLPLLAIASWIYPEAIPIAGILTLSIFAGLTIAVFITKKDFSFLRPILSVAFMVALGFIIISLFIPGGFGRPIYMGFAFLMVALIAGAILYQPSAVMRHYRTHQHVAAALGLFASVATMFYYILMLLLMSRD